MSSTRRALPPIGVPADGAPAAAATGTGTGTTVRTSERPCSARLVFPG
jgi:hypothetical protein